MSSSSSVVNFKVLLAGMSNSGKSSLVKRFVENQFSHTTQATAGPEVSQFIYHPDDLEQGGGGIQLDKTAQDIFNKTTLRLSIFDCPGQDSLVKMTPQSMRNSNAAFICFDVTYRPSFEQIPKWLDLVRSLSPNALCILVGCKCDLEDSREVQKPEADALARELDLAYFETSAKTSDNVEPTFKFVAVTLRQSWYANRPKQSQQTTTNRVNIGADQRERDLEQQRKNNSGKGGCCK